MEDQLLASAFAKRGVHAIRVEWACDVDWGQFDAAIVRQTWDYFDRLKDFAQWVSAVSEQTRLINPSEVLRWNWDKRYLLDLISQQLPTVATERVLTNDHSKTLTEHMESKGWAEVVIKPAVSASGYETHRVSIQQALSRQPTWAQLVTSHDMLIQPFQHSIIDHGEISLMVVGGHVTHAVRKIAKQGEFRVQSDHGGRVEIHRPQGVEISLAEAAMQAAPLPCCYGRVDLVESADGPLIMELELIEPELFFRLEPRAADVLVDAVLA